VAVLLVILFIVLPVAEIYVIIKIGGAIGVLPTIALLILDGLLGAALLRSQGRAAWRRFNEALAAGKIPAREVFDGAMVIMGGALLITPGFITDIFGLLLLIPPSRAMLRGIVTKIGLGRAAFAVRTVQWGSTTARNRYRGRSGGPRGGYDYEGSAREVGEHENQLPKPRGDGES
jgi:UPF0716 protein FxsA